MTHDEPQAYQESPSRESLLSELGLVGRSAPLLDVVETCQRVAPTEATVLLLGETGTGKELLARAIHRCSGREGEFVAVNCGGLTETLAEAELFGHEQGAFTGAVEARAGLFRRAHRGTLFLDEVCSLPVGAQRSLLRALQERRVRPVGSAHEVPVDLRVVAATCDPLTVAVAEGRFREDLYYRLDVIRVVVPPLRERPEDVLALFDAFTARLAERHGAAPPRIEPSFREALRAYPWPGNVRQLENLVERLVVTGRSDQPLTGADLAALTAEGRSEAPSQRGLPVPPEQLDLDRSLDEVLNPLNEVLERRYLLAVLSRTGGNLSQAARIAGISRRTLARRMERLGLDRSDFQRARASAEEDAVGLWLTAPPLRPLPLDGERLEVTIGRDALCDLSVTLADVSRVHARVRRRGDGWFVEDADSRNGTWLNGERVETPTPIGHGDTLRVGSATIEVVACRRAPVAHATTAIPSHTSG